MEGEFRDLKYEDPMSCCCLEPEGTHVSRLCKALNSIPNLNKLGSGIFLGASRNNWRAIPDPPPSLPC